MYSRYEENGVRYVIMEQLELKSIMREMSDLFKELQLNKTEIVRLNAIITPLEENKQELLKRQREIQSAITDLQNNAQKSES